MDKQSGKKAPQPSQSLPVVDNMENTRRKTPSLVETEECIKKTPTAEPTTSASTVDEMERTRDTVSTPVETEEKFLKETLTVVDEMQTDELPSTADTEEECLLEPWTVVSIMSLSSDDESISDEESSTVETVEKCPKETSTVESTASILVAVGEIENMTYGVPSSGNTEQERLKEPSTVEPTTSAPVFDEMDNYTADAVCKVPDFEEDIAELKVPKKVLQEQFYRVCFFLFALRFRSNQTEWKS